MEMDIEIESLAGPRVTRKAYAAAAIACVLVIAAGAIVLKEQVRLARLAHVAIDEDAVHSLWANRVVVSALQCRRYEKDSFLNLNDAPTAHRLSPQVDPVLGKTARRPGTPEGGTPSSGREAAG